MDEQEGGLHAHARQENGWRLEPEGGNGDAGNNSFLEGIPGYPDGEGRHDRVHCEGAEQIGDAPQLWEETVDEELPVPRERVQQGTAEQIGDGPQLLARPPGIAEQPENAAEAVDTTKGAKSVCLARPRDDVKYSATATGTTVAKPVGEARPFGVMQRDTTEPDIPVSSGEAMLGLLGPERVA